MKTTLGPTRQRFAIDRSQTFFVFVAAAQVIVFVIIWRLLLGDGHPKEAEQAAYICFLLSVPMLTLAGWAATRQVHEWGAERIADIYLWTLLYAAVPALVLGFGLRNITRVIYYSYDAVPRLPPYSTLRLAVGVCLGAILFASLVWAESRARQMIWRTPTIGMVLMWAIGIALLLGLFDPHLMIDTLCLSPYVGPAFAVWNGLVPMVDTFSQYGPNFVIFAAAFAVAPTFYMASALVSALNVVMGLTFVSIATALGRCRRFCFAGAVFIVLFLQAAYLYNITYSPSVFAMRFLPPLLLVAALARVPVGKSVTLLSAAAIILCSLWSFEALASGLIIYATWLFVRSLCERQLWMSALREAAILSVLVLMPHALVMLAYLALFGTPPRYDIYLELIFVQLGGGYWLMPVEAGIYTWILFGFSYASALALAGFWALTGMADSRVVSGLAAVAMLGALYFCYYVGRSATPILMFVAMPLMLLILLSCDWAVSVWLKRDKRALPILATPTLVASLVLFAFMGAALVDRILEPISRHLSNSTFLRACLPDTNETNLCNPSSVLRLITEPRVASIQYPTDESGGSLTYTYSENRTEFELIQRVALTDGGRVLLFGTDPVPVIFHSPQAVAKHIIYPPHAIGIVYPAVDGLSPTLRNRALASVEELRPGDILIRGSLPIYALDDQVLSAIEARWTLCAEEKVKTVQVFKLAVPGEGACDAS